MKTSLEKSFEVPQQLPLVWEHLIDPAKVMECVPGVQIGDKIEENKYNATVGLKLGPIGAQYKAKVSYESIDEENRKIILQGNGVDKRGNGNAQMDMTMTVSENPDGGSNLQAIMEVSISGKIAQFGSRLVQSVSNQLYKQFVSNFKKRLEEAEQS
ncbi:SRPBCC family protein [Poritiphilus flavus]|uniref:Carbon monoxide dehydrogenase n=1 Tax=Poritiphilus flavus TaxID=2697053 RepID=A0A6L9EEN0_9FLAO|nr:SRPBCC family protein [Poritiphilus flavus]NAS13224.1 carbon monoxide dehydrogenase [Poritiphilus flavus]